MATLLQTRTARRVRGVLLGVLLFALVSLWVLPVTSAAVRTGLSALIALMILTNSVWTVLITEWIWDRRATAPALTGPPDAGEMGMTEPSVTWERVGDHAQGPVIVVRFSGVYPRGFAGNRFAYLMVGSLESVLVETGAAGVVLDLTELDYGWGDAIGGLAMPLQCGTRVPAGASSGKLGRFRPAAAVASGITAQALKPLLEPHTLLGIAGVKLFPTTLEAVVHVEEVLDRAG